MYNNDPKQLGRNLSSFQFIDLIKQVARTASETLLGGGIEFKHKNEKYHEIGHEFVNRTNLFNIMGNSEELMSSVGLNYITLNRAIDGTLGLNIAQPYFSNGMGYCFANEELAVMYERFEIDNKGFIIKSVYDKQKTVRTLWDETTQSRVDVFEYQEKLPANKRFREVDKHNFGFVPVFGMYNRPYFPFITNYGNNIYGSSPGDTTYNQSLFNSGLNTLADGANCSGLPTLANFTIQQFYKELAFAKTRVISNSGVNSFQDNALANNDNQGDLINSDFFINKNGGEQVSVQQNQNHFIDYQNSYDYVIKLFFKLCGYSYVGETNAAQKTAEESFQRYDDTLRTVEGKRTGHGKQGQNIIEKCFKAMGIDLNAEQEDGSFEIRRNVIVDKAALIDNLTKQQQLGIVDRPEMISQVRNVDYDTAEHICDAIDERNEKDEITPAIMAGQGVEGVKGANFQSGEVSGVKAGDSDKGGRPTK